MSKSGPEYKHGPCIVVDYGKPVNLHEEASKKSPIVGTVNPGEVLDGYEKHVKNGHQWLEFPVGGYLYVGKQRAGEWKDPAVIGLGKVATLGRLLARLPSLRGYR